jgi:LPXTG-motif cell wall-anchored protein
MERKRLMTLGFNSRKAFVLTCGITLAVGALAWHAQADQWNKKTILTVSTPVQVRDTLLEPGQYVLKLLDSQSDRHIVQIFNGDQTHIISTVLAIPAYRVEPRGHTAFTFWETPPGYAKALRTWYYPGDNFGQEFPYPKQLAMLTTTSSNAVETQTEQAQTQEAPPPPQQEEQQAQTQEQTEVAQATPPPAPAEQPQETTPAPAPQPETLPKTGTAYPLVGFAGLLMIGLYGLLRLKRFV